MDPQAEQTLQQTAQDRRTRFFGKYRGTVLDALTGSDLGKLSVSVPDVLADQAATAWPCVPFAGPKHGFVAIPEVGDGVWVEFESGNPAQPVWTGCWWAAGDVPTAADTTVRAWITSGGLQLLLDDKQNQISLVHPSGPSIVMTADGITLQAGTAKVTLDAQGIGITGNVKVGS